ncbi:MAG: hypothetical protein NTW95_11915 [Candidatus Aminicenantes bacterium]|nr:hypothetical protein [Candidatus Aminicenantes bacterium]
MIKKQQKWVALLVTLTFMGLLQVSTMPCEAAAANTTEQISAANTEQGPRFIEEEGNSGVVGKKKSILPIVLIGVGVVAVAAVLFLVVLKTSYDIVGTWSETDTIWTEGATTIIFSGDKASGTLTLAEFDDTGTYTVDGKNVHFEFSIAGYTYKWVFDGAFDEKDKMSGTVQYLNNNAVVDTGTWTATRTSGSAGSGKLPMATRSARKLQ